MHEREVGSGRSRKPVLWLMGEKITEKTLHIGRKTDQWQETLQVVGKTRKDWNCSRDRLWWILGQFKAFLLYFLTNYVVFIACINFLPAVLKNRIWVYAPPTKIENKHAAIDLRPLLTFCVISSWWASKSPLSFTVALFFPSRIAHIQCEQHVAAKWPWLQVLIPRALQ